MSCGEVLGGRIFTPKEPQYGQAGAAQGARDG